MTKRPIWFWSMLLLGLAGSLLAGGPDSARAAGDRETAQARLTLDADAIILSEDVEVDFDDAGHYVQTVRRRVRVLTEAGRSTYAVEHFSYHQEMSRVEFVRGAVLKPDGTTLPVKAAAVRDALLPEFQQAGLLNVPFRRKSVAFADLAVQDILETEFRIEGTAPLPGQYLELFLFQYLNPIFNKVLVIRGPAAKPLYHAVKGGRLEASRSTAEDRLVYRWEARDVPGVPVEPGMVALPGVALRLLVSTLPDWPSLSREGGRQDYGKTTADAAMVDKVAELTEGLSSAHSRIMAIYRFVSQQVRYFNVALPAGAFLEPRPASDVLAGGFATGREKTILMMAMLQQIGVDSVDCLLDASRETDPELPTLYLERCVCGVRLDDGRTVYMDPALELGTSLGETYVGDRWVLALTPSGAELARIPHSPAARSRGQIRADSTLGADGRLESRIRIQGAGYYDFILRSLGRKSRGVEFSRMWQQTARKFHPEARITGLQVGTAEDLGSPFSVSFIVDCPGYWLPLGRFVLVRPPLYGNGFDLYAQGLPPLAEPETRLAPLGLWSTVQVEQEEGLAIPAGYAVAALPDPVQVQAGPFRLELSSRLDGDRIFFSSLFCVDTAMVDPVAYLEFRRVIQSWQRHQRAYLILEQTAPGGRS